MMRDFAIVWQNADRLFAGLANTVLLSVSGTILAILLGGVLAMAAMAQSTHLRTAIRTMIETFRCIPFLLLTYLIYYGMPSLGVSLGNWTAGLVAIVIYNSAYFAEIIRGAWIAMPAESANAGRAFGFHGSALYLRIILPQIALSSAPMFGNQVIQLIRDTAFLSIIAVPELTHAASSIQSKYYVAFAAFAAAVGLYWLLCSVVEAGVRSVERMADARR